MVDILSHLGDGQVRRGCSAKNILNRIKSNIEKGILVVQGGKAGKKLSDSPRRAGLRCQPPPSSLRASRGVCGTGLTDEGKRKTLGPSSRGCCHTLKELERNTGCWDCCHLTGKAVKGTSDLLRGCPTQSREEKKRSKWLRTELFSRNRGCPRGINVPWAQWSATGRETLKLFDAVRDAWDWGSELY